MTAENAMKMAESSENSIAARRNLYFQQTPWPTDSDKYTIFVDHFVYYETGLRLLDLI